MGVKYNLIKRVATIALWSWISEKETHDIPANYTTPGLSNKPYCIQLFSSNKGNNEARWSLEITYVSKLILAASSMSSSTKKIKNKSMSSSYK